MSKKNKGKGFTLPDFKTYYKVIVTKTMTLASRHTYRAMKENKQPRNYAGVHGQMVFNKGVKTIQWRNDSLVISRQMVLEKLEYLYVKE